MEWTASEFCDQSALGSEAAVCVPVAFDLLGRSVPGPDEIEAAGIEMAPAQSGTIAHRIIVPSTIVPHADRIAHVAVKLSGTVAELRKKLCDQVATDEVLAILGALALRIISRAS